MADLKLTQVNNLFYHIEAETSIHWSLREYFSCEIPNKEFNPKFKHGRWNGSISFYHVANHTLPAGLLEPLKGFCKQFNYTYEVHDIASDHEILTPQETKEFAESVIMNPDIKPYSHQLKSLYKVIQKRNGVLQIATGGGKSLIIYLIIQWFLEIFEPDEKILLVVPNVDLVEQMFGDFVNYGMPDAYNMIHRLYGGKSKEFDKPILISTWQSLKSKKPKFFQQFKGIMFDEVHGNKNNSLLSKKIAINCTEAEYRVGLTGTLPEETVDKLNIFAAFGPVLARKKAHELQEAGVLSKMKIISLLLNYDPVRVKALGKMTYQDEVKQVLEMPEREKGVKFIVDKLKPGENIMVLCSKHDELDYYREVLKRLAPHKKLVDLHGKVDKDERKEVRESFEDCEDTILLSTYKACSTGINIKKLHHVVFGSSLKAEVSILQSIGRGLRLHETKNHLYLWDIVDNLSFKQNRKTHRNYIYKHWRKRKYYYDREKFENKTVEIKL